MTTDDPDAHSRESSAPADPTAWFEELYAEAAEGRATVPWDRDAPSQLVENWVETHASDGAGHTAVIVGCSYGRDAELIARHGYRTMGFDVAPTVIEAARERHPGSPVDYRVGDLLDLPDEWLGAFDLVIESMNVQGLPAEVRPAAIAGVRSLVAPGGTLFVMALAGDDREVVDRPPWPLTRAEIEDFGTGLATRSIERITGDADPSISRWSAEFARESA